MHCTKAVHNARPQLLEPILNVTIETGDSHFGDVSADLSARRGRLTGTDSVQPGRAEILPRYRCRRWRVRTRMTSISGGDSLCRIEFSHYEAVPGDCSKTRSQTGH